MISTETPVERIDWSTGERYLEVLCHEPGCVDLSRAPLPVLEGHDSARVNIGIVENLRLDGSKLRGELVLGSSQRADELTPDIDAKIVSGLSVGYDYDPDDKREETDEDGTRRVFRTWWQPLETSIVGVPADTESGIGRSRGMPMRSRRGRRTPHRPVAPVAAPAPGASRHVARHVGPQVDADGAGAGDAGQGSAPEQREHRGPASGERRPGQRAGGDDDDRAADDEDDDERAADDEGDDDRPAECDDLDPDDPEYDDLGCGDDRGMGDEDEGERDAEPRRSRRAPAQHRPSRGGGRGGVPAQVSDRPTRRSSGSDCGCGNAGCGNGTGGRGRQHRPTVNELVERRLRAERERLRAERESDETIHRQVENAGLPASTARRFIREEYTPLEVAEEIARRQRQRDRQIRGDRRPTGHVEMVRDQEDTQRTGITNALLHRAVPTTKLDDNARRFAGLTLLDITKLCLRARAINYDGWSKREVAKTALGIRSGGLHSASDFPNITSDLAGKVLRQRYMEAPQTFLPIVRKTTLPDFKSRKVMQLSESPPLSKIVAGGRYERGTMGEGKEQYSLSKYGAIFAITWEAIVDDDLDAFTRIPGQFGQSARNLESDLVWAQITGNPTMGDGVALFHSSHGNIGTAADIDVDPVGEARALLRLQRGIARGIDDNGEVIPGSLLNLSAKYLIVPAKLETDADKLVSPVIYAGQVSDANVFTGRLQVIAEPRLDAVDEDTWYVSSDPSQIDMVEAATFEDAGAEGPMVDSRVGFDVDGQEFKCTHLFAAKVIDWRGFVRNAGA